MTVHFHIDSDGVLADFEGGFREMFGVEHDSIAESVMWDKILKHDDFWGSLPLLPGAERLVGLFANKRVSILTGAPKTGWDVAVVGKRRWYANNFPHLNVQICRSYRKPDYMTNKGDVLIDDLAKNCKRWEAAGGIAFQYHPNKLDELEAFVASF